MLRCVIVDDDDRHNQDLCAMLRASGCDEVTVCESVARGEDMLSGCVPELLILSLELDDALKLLELPATADCIDVVVMADEDDPRQVTEAIAKGATFFSCKPLSEGQFLQQLLDDLVAELNASTDATLKKLIEPCPLNQFGNLRGDSRAMRKLFRTIRKVAASDTAVLLAGESGTGKELIASTIHQFSDRVEGPYVTMNCGAIPSELFESELFGHEKGSFTGAAKRHIGYYERADGGTLFLDEITEMAPHNQVKLLRVLETGRFRRVGGEIDLAADVRVIAATNRPPEAAIKAGTLRDDLYYRIARFPIHVPPLRERGQDIEQLAQYFLNGLNEASETEKAFTASALEKLNGYAWPGNVRELKSAVEHAYLMADDLIDAEHFPDMSIDVMSDDEHIRIPIGTSIDDSERHLIMATLAAHDGDKKAAAEVLGISLKTLYNRLNEYSADSD